MVIKNKDGQSIVELVFICLIFSSILLAFQSFIENRNSVSNKFKLSKEKVYEYKYSK